MEASGGVDMDDEPRPGPSSACTSSYSSSMPSTPSSQACASNTPPYTHTRFKQEQDPDDDSIRDIKDGVANLKTEPVGATPPLSPGSILPLKDQPFELSKEQMEDIKEALDTLDPEGTGFIKTVELKIAMRALGFEPRKEEIQTLLAKIDKDKTGRISHSDFISIITAKLAENDTRVEIAKAFKLFDRDEVGKITLKNLQEIAAELGEPLSEEELQEMIDEADRNGDGVVDPDEFFRIMKKTNLY